MDRQPSPSPSRGPRLWEMAEFFAGGGMARAGVGADGSPGARWRVTLANDFDAAKCRAYRANWGDAGGHLLERDVADLSPEHVPGRPDLAWASTPCQDLSLAGAGLGLGSVRQGEVAVVSCSAWAAS